MIPQLIQRGEDDSKRPPLVMREKAGNIFKQQVRRSPGFSQPGNFKEESASGHCEIDKYADASYRAIHDIGKEEKYYPDAREIDPGDLPHFDLLCGGFPCQAFSNAGKRKGFDDARGTLFFEIARLAEARRPAYLISEDRKYLAGASGIKIADKEHPLP